MTALSPNVILQGRMLNTTPPGSVLCFRSSVPIIGAVSSISLGLPNENRSIAWEVLVAFARSYPAPIAPLNSCPGLSPGAPPPPGGRPSQTAASKSRFELNNDGIVADKHAVVFNGPVTRYSVNRSSITQIVNNKNLHATGYSVMFNGPIDADPQGMVDEVRSAAHEPEQT